MSNDLELMVGETLNLVDSYHGRDPFHIHDSFEGGEVPEDVPEGSGLLFRVHVNHKSRFFTIHCFPGENIRKDFGEFCGEIRESRRLDEIHWFSTDYFEMAQIICSQMEGKKFPLERERGHNHGWGEEKEFWWILDREGSFEIYFRPWEHLPQSFKEKKENQEGPIGMFRELGPLGESLLSGKRFHEILPHLRDILPQGEFHSDEFHVQVRAKEGGIKDINILKSLFIEGKRPSGNLEICLQKLDQTYYHYLLELCEFRRFWLQVESILETP